MEDRIRLLNGNCLEELKKLEDNSIDSIVTDPPYELGFMGKAWDASGIAFNVDVWRECLRVLKPGGHILSFGGTRTYHRMTVAIEDAGFEIRDCIAWMYGSGFPKSHNIGKAIDKLEGNEREVVGEKTGGAYSSATNNLGIKHVIKNGEDGRKTLPTRGEDFGKITKGNSDWEGWGTSLKPAFEPVVMGRKPLVGTVANNVLTYGVGGLNIDESRVNTTDNLNGGGYGGNNVGVATYALGDGRKTPPTNKLTKDDFIQPEGRWPANVILDEEAGRILDEQSGTSKSVKRGAHNNKKTEHTNTYTPAASQYGDNNTYGDSGGASRFFYCPKASKSDRDEGMDLSKDKQRPGQTDKGLYSSSPVCKDCGKTVNGTNDHSKCKEGLEYRPSTTTRKNIHPTVKPTELMKYLIRLVTPKGGVVLDPFMGSGSTGKAAVLEGMEFIGIEREEEYYEIAKQRIENETNKRKFW
jgi:site-specific DNA-methyltransferase (adenine-specific)